MVNLLSGAENCKMLQPKINPNDAGACVPMRAFNFALDGYEVFAGLAFRHGNVLRSSFQRAMKDGFHPSDFRKIGLLPVEFEALRVADRLNLLAGFEVRIARAFQKNG